MSAYCVLRAIARKDVGRASRAIFARLTSTFFVLESALQEKAPLITSIQKKFLCKAKLQYSKYRFRPRLHDIGLK